VVAYPDITCRKCAQVRANPAPPRVPSPQNSLGQLADYFPPLAQNHFMVFFTGSELRTVTGVSMNNPFAANNLRVSKTESSTYRAAPAASN
jgi:hypothetical protein